MTNVLTHRPLSQEQRSMLSAMIDDLWRFRCEQISQLDASLSATDPSEPDVQRQIKRRILSAARTVHADLQAAKNRLADGTYGWCVTCTEPLPFERLAALPHAARCEKCQFEGPW